MQVIYKIILDWLKTKINYVYFSPEDEFDIINQKVKNFQNRLGLLLITSRIHNDDLEASTCYLVESKNCHISVDFKNPNKRNYTFKNFNIPINEYIYDISFMYNISQNYTSKDIIKNRAGILLLLKELRLKYTESNKFIDKNSKITYKNFFNDFSKYNIFDNIKDIENLMVSNNFDFEDFDLNYISSILSTCKNINEVGVFYPCKIDHDIFKNEFYILEINHLRFQRSSNIDLFKKIKKFHERKFTLDFDSKNIPTLEKYFNGTGHMATYSNYIAYFDPFRYIEKYYKELQVMVDYVKKQNFDANKFLFELFDFFNLAQFTAVKYQHTNLLDLINTTRSQNRQYSFKDMVDIQIEQIDYMIQNYNQPGYQHSLTILYLFKKALEKITYTKDTTIDDLGCKHLHTEFKEFANTILKEIRNELVKDTSLQDLYNHLIDKLEIVIKPYDFKKEHKNIILDTIKDLIFFYDSKNTNNKLSKQLNVKLHDIYLKNQKLDISKEINLDFQKEFIKKYQDEFDKINFWI